MRFNEPLQTFHHVCECGTEHTSEVYALMELVQGYDFLADENAKCLDCLEKELFGEEIEEQQDEL